MAFDVAGARREGYSDQEIAGFLARQSRFNLDAARKEGYADAEIINFLTRGTREAAPSAPEVEAASRPARMTLSTSGQPQIASDIGQLPPLAEPEPSLGDQWSNLLKPANAAPKPDRRFEAANQVARGMIERQQRVGTAAELAEMAKMDAANELASVDVWRGVGASLQSVPADWKQIMGGALRLAGEALPESDSWNAAKRKMTAIGTDLYAQGNRDIAEAYRGLQPGFGTQAIGSAVRSLGAMLPILATGGLTGSPAAVIGLMSGETGAKSYGQARDQGLDPGQAAVYAALQATIEGGTEYLPIKTLFRRDLTAGRQFLNFLSREVPSELVATTLQDAVDKVSLQPDMTMRDLYNDLALTAVSTPLAGAGQVGAMRALRTAQRPNPLARIFAARDSGEAISTAMSAAFDDTGTATAPQISSARSSNIEPTQTAMGPLATQPIPQAPRVAPTPIAVPTVAPTPIAPTPTRANVLPQESAPTGEISPENIGAVPPFSGATTRAGVPEYTPTQIAPRTPVAPQIEAETAPQSEPGDLNAAWERGVSPVRSEPGHPRDDFPVLLNGYFQIFKAAGLDADAHTVAGWVERNVPLPERVSFDDARRALEPYIDTQLTRLNAESSRVINQYGGPADRLADRYAEAADGLRKSFSSARQIAERLIPDTDSAILFSEALDAAINEKMGQAARLRAGVDEAARADVVTQAASYQPHIRGPVKLPTRSEVGMTQATKNTGTGWYSVTFDGDPAWSNGHILDRNAPPYQNFEALLGETPPRTVGHDASEIVSRIGATVEAVPVAFTTVDTDQLGPHVLMRVGENLVAFQKSYFDYFSARYPGARFMVNPDAPEMRPAVVKDGDRIAGLMMPVRTNMADALRARLLERFPATTAQRAEEPFKGYAVQGSEDAYQTLPTAEGQGSSSQLEQAPAAPDGDVHAGPALRGTGEVVVEPAKTGELRTGFTNIDSAAKAAHALASLRRSPQERFFVLALDSENKPLAVLRLHAGSISQTQVAPEIIAKAVYQTPGAAKVWLAHNHPSGVAQPSRADEVLTRQLGKLFGRGTGVEVSGHVIIAGTQFAELNGEGSLVDRGQILPAARTSTIPITERVVRKAGSEYRSAVASPIAAREALRSESNGQAGVLMLDAQNRSLGFLPMSLQEMARLRTADVPGADSGARRFFENIGRRNAHSIIIYSPGSGNPTPEFKRAARNVATAAHVSDIKVLDALYGDRDLYARGEFPMPDSETFAMRAPAAMNSERSNELRAQAVESQRGAEQDVREIPPEIPPGRATDTTELFGRPIAEATDAELRAAAKSHADADARRASDREIDRRAAGETKDRLAEVENGLRRIEAAKNIAPETKARLVAMFEGKRARAEAAAEQERPAVGIALTPPYTGTAESQVEATSSARPDTIRQAIRDLFRVPINERGFKGSRDKLGIYKVKPQTIRIKNQNDIGVIAHETGHHFSETSRPVRELVKAHEGELRSITPYAAEQRSAKAQREEGFAEYLRLRWTQPAQAEAKAPGFSTAFEQYIDDNGYRPAFDAIEGAINDWQNLPPADRILAKVGDERPDFRKRFNVDRIIFEVFDRWLPMKRMVEDLKPDIAPSADPFKLAHLLSGDSAIIEDWLLRETIPFDFTRRANVEDRGKSFADILKPIEDQEREFGAYLIAKRANELMKRGKEHLYSQDEISAGLRLETPEFKKAAEEIYAYQDQVLQYAVEGGLLSQYVADKFRQFPAYVPFFRVGEPIARRGGDIFKAIHGGTENLKADPIALIIENTVRVIHATNRNYVLAMARDLARAVPGGGRWIEDVPMPERKVMIATQDVIDQLRQQGITVDTTTAQAIATAQAFFVKNPFGDEQQRIVVVRRSGRAYAIQINDDMMWHALERFEPVDMGLVEKALSVPADILRAGIVLSPEFMARNFARDTLSGFIQSKKGMLPVAGTVNGFKEILTRSDAARLYRAFGGAYGDMWRADHGMERVLVERMAKHGGFDPRTIVTPRGLISLLHRLGSLTEAGTRVAEFKKSMEPGNIDSLIDAAYNAREVSVDFGMHGHSRTVRFLTRITPFMNPALQGWYKAARTVGDQPLATVFRGGMLALASILLFLNNRDKDWYTEIEQWEKNTYWHLDIGLRDPQGQVIPLRIPKPFEWGGFFASIPEALAEVSIKQHGEKFAKRLASIVDDVFTFRVVPSAILLPTELWGNKNTFTGRPIVPESKEKLAPELQATPGTSLTAKKAGEIANVAPAKIDHAMRGLFGTLGTYSMMLADQAIRLDESEAKSLPIPWQRAPVVRAFFHDPSGANSQYVTEFYDLLREARKAEQSLKYMPPERMQEYYEKHRREIEQARSGAKVARMMGQLRSENDRIRESRDLPESERMKIITENNRVIRWLAREYMQDNDRAAAGAR